MTLVAALKTLHIAGLVVWCAGLLVIPSLFRERAFARSHDQLMELQRYTRAVFIGITSPAAFVAIGAGTVLIFVADVFTLWMFAKLAAVGALAGIHVRAGFVIVHLYEPNHGFAAWRQVLGTAAAVAAIAVILTLVLAKPDLAEVAVLPEWMIEPGGLQSLLETMRPMP